MRQWVLSAVSLCCASAALAITPTLHHQGRLLDALGAPLDGSVIANFDLYADDTSTVSLWDETHSLAVSDGYYGVVLGETTPLTPEFIASNSELWIAISIGGSEFQRSPLGSVPSALTAETLGRTDCSTNEVLSYDGSAWQCTAVPSLTGSRNSVFKRWGRIDCPTGSNVVYAGFMANGHFDHPGSSSNYLCLHPTPEYDSRAGATNNNQGILYQVEFEMNVDPHAYLRPLHDFEARCAVCETQADMELMIPGTRSCPSGWTEQYDGFLMSHHHAQAKPTNAICVDQNPVAFGTPTNHNGALLYTVEFDQGGGTVPQTSNREVTCVVCTK